WSAGPLAGRPPSPAKKIRGSCRIRASPSVGQVSRAVARHHRCRRRGPRRTDMGLTWPGRRPARQLSRPGTTRGWALVLTSAAFFMVALDALVVITALPAIHHDFGGNVSTLEWTVNAYTLSFAAGIITAAAIGDRLGRRRVYVAGLLLFTAASAACALAPSAGTLIAARAVQGIGAAIVTPLSLTILTTAWPAQRRGTIVGIWGGIAGLAVAAGPLVGGAVVQGLNWHWIFWVNVPIGLAAAI